ncbi:transporter substrate-binding domain-containing protein [Planctomycetota bacterium]
MKKTAVQVATLVVLLILSASTTFSAQENDVTNGSGQSNALTPEAQDGIGLSQNSTYVIKRDEPITIVYPVVMPPYTFEDDTGEAQGLAVDLLRLWSNKTGIPIRFTSAPWDEGLQMMREGKADVHASLYYSEQRDAYLDYATVVASSAGSIFTHKSILSLSSPEDLRAYRVGVVRGSYHEEYVRKNLPEGTLVSYPEWPAMVMAAQNGDIRVFVDDLGATLYRLKERGLVGEFRHNPAQSLYRNNFWLAVREGDAELVETLQQGMALITPAERATLERKWLPTSTIKTEDVLFIAMYSDFAPFTFINAEGKPAGLFVDIWKLWAEKAGKKIEFFSGNWNDSLDRLRQGGADIHSGLFFSDARAQWLNYSQPFYETGSCFFYPSTQKMPYKMGIYAGKKVGVIKGSYHEEHMRVEHPEVVAIPFVSMEKMLRAVLSGETSACLTEYSSATALIDRLGLSGMFVFEEPMHITQKFHAGILKENTQLLTLVDEGFNSITSNELANIEQRWVPNLEKRYYKLPAQDISLTEEEHTWLKAHPDIVLGYTDTLEPDVIVNSDGTYSGMVVDILNELNEKLGTDIRLGIYPIPKLLKNAQERKVDGILNIHPEYSEELGLLTTQAYWPAYMAVFARKGILFDSPEDFTGKRVAVIDGVYFTNKYMEQYGKKATIIKVEDALTGLRSIDKGEVDYFLGASYNSYYIPKYQIFGVFCKGRSKTAAGV